MVLVNGFPAARIATEIKARYHKLNKRSDAMLFDEYGKYLLLMEFKANKIPINEKTMHQVLTYNAFFMAPNILLSNGSTHLLWRAATQTWMNSFPNYTDLTPCK